MHWFCLQSKIVAWIDFDCNVTIALTELPRFPDLLIILVVCGARDRKKRKGGQPFNSFFAEINYEASNTQSNHASEVHIITYDNHVVIVTLPYTSILRCWLCVKQFFALQFETRKHWHEREEIISELMNTNSRPIGHSLLNGLATFI